MNILLLDTAFAAAPIYKYLVGAGHQVWTMGNRSGDLLARLAGERWIEQDYSDIESVREWVGAKHIEHLVPGCTDVSIDTYSNVLLDAGLRHEYSVNRIFSDKRAFREFCTGLGLPSPKVFEQRDFPVSGTYICKPVDAFSGRGITVFDGADPVRFNDALQTALAASPSASIILEEFLEGQLYSCSAFVERQRIVESFFVLEGSSANPFAVDTSYLTTEIPDDIVREIETSLEKIARSLELRDGLIHAQFMIARDQPFLIEVTRRCPGDLYSLLIEFSTGFSYAAKYASCFIGDTVHSRRARSRFVIRHTVASVEQAIFTGLQFDPPRSVLACFPLMAVGQDLRPRQGSRAGIIFCEYSTYGQMLNDYDRFISREVYTT
jgi:hypothetical protein